MPSLQAHFNKHRQQPLEDFLSFPNPKSQFPQTRIKPKPRLNRIYNGDLPLKLQISPRPDQTHAWETRPLYLQRVQPNFSSTVLTAFGCTEQNNMNKTEKHQHVCFHQQGPNRQWRGFLFCLCSNKSRGSRVLCLLMRSFLEKMNM